jgi:hypothetical protein
LNAVGLVSAIEIGHRMNLCFVVPSSQLFGWVTVTIGQLEKTRKIHKLTIFFNNLETVVS